MARHHHHMRGEGSEGQAEPPARTEPRERLTWSHGTPGPDPWGSAHQWWSSWVVTRPTARRCEPTSVRVPTTGGPEPGTSRTLRQKDSFWLCQSRRTSRNPSGTTSEANKLLWGVRDRLGKVTSERNTCWSWRAQALLSTPTPTENTRKYETFKKKKKGKSTIVQGQYSVWGVFCTVLPTFLEVWNYTNRKTCKKHFTNEAKSEISWSDRLLILIPYSAGMLIL